MARPLHPEWVRALRDQCQAAGVPFFFEQWGEFLPAAPSPGEERRPEGPPSAPAAAGAPPRFRRVGRSRAGCTLDGRTWLEVPPPPG
jgi:Protein of unknown function (DUF5131)